MKRPEDSATTLRDTQSEPDHRRIVIDRVGVKNLRFPIQIAVGTAAAIRGDTGKRPSSPVASRPVPCSPEHPGEGEAYVVDLTGAKRGAIFDRGVANRLQLTAALQGLLRAR